MKKLIGYTRLLLVLGLAAGGAGSLWAQTGNVKGRVLDKDNLSGIPFANVVLVKAADSTQVMGTASSDSGSFSFKRIPAGSYFVQVAVLGYHRNNSPVFKVDAGHREIDLGEIGMTSASVQLDKVVIRAKRPLMEMEAGKITMNVSQSIIAQEDNAFEMLKKFPGITVDKDDNISLNGKGGVMVTVDDRPTHLSGQNLANYLRSMPGNSVDKIETMNNPSSKYDAEGVSGIINIKTTKIQNSGFSGSVDAGIRIASKVGYNAGIDLNYRHKKFTVYGSFSAYQGYNSQYFSGYTHYADGSRQEVNGKESGRRSGMNNYLSFYGKGGLDYYISKADVLSLTYQGSGGKYRNDFNNLRTRFYPVQTPDSVLYTFDQTANSTYDEQNHNVNLNYEHTFDTVYNRKLTLNFDYIRNIEKSHGSNGLNYYTGDFNGNAPALATGYDLSNPFSSDIYSFKADYEHPFNTQTRLEAGLKFSYTGNNYRYFYTEFDSATVPNRYLYNEIIGAAYAMVNHTFKTKTVLQVGVRAEYTRTHGKNLDMDSANTNQYIRPFPNISISQPIGSKNQLSLSYRYRLSRPGYYSLNPFLTRNQADQYSAGNPFLKPEYSHVLDLTYSFNYKFFATVGYVHTDGTPQQINFYGLDPDGRPVTFRQTVNAGKSDRLDINLSTQLTFFKIWRLSVFLNGSYGEEHIKYRGMEESRRTFTSGYWINTEVDAHKNLTLSAYSWGTMPTRSLFEYNYGIYGGGLGLKAFFLDKTLTLSASFYASFTGYDTKSTYPEADGRKTVSKMHYGWDMYTGRISLSYRFGNNKLMNRNPRQKAAADESSRLGGGGGGSNARGN
ncbi:MAG: TonB-dependent receptor [Bacteroides sp.]|nr:TonB-dependent receptor [Ruminococcus flavefaciens]MCM1554328.1 TonB-dependent receptor [Bacteroides sp.]